MLQSLVLKYRIVEQVVNKNVHLMDKSWFTIPARKVGNYIISLKCFYMQIHLQISYMWACASSKEL